MVPVTSYDTAGSYLLLGGNNGSIYYIGRRVAQGERHIVAWELLYEM